MNNMWTILIIALVLFVVYLIWKISRLLTQQLGYEQSYNDALRYLWGGIAPQQLQEVLQRQ